MAASSAVDPTSEPSIAERKSKVPSRLRMVMVLGAVVALGPLTIDMYLPALPKIADDLEFKPCQKRRKQCRQSS